MTKVISRFITAVLFAVFALTAINAHAFSVGDYQGKFDVGISAQDGYLGGNVPQVRIYTIPGLRFNGDGTFANDAYVQIRVLAPNQSQGGGGHTCVSRVNRNTSMYAVDESSGMMTITLDMFPTSGQSDASCYTAFDPFVGYVMSSGWGSVADVSNKQNGQSSVVGTMTVKPSGVPATN